jgi:hypothetical protein
MTLPCSTTRRLVGRAPKRSSSARSSQWLVASRPWSTPAAPRSSEPVQTEVVHSDVSWARRIQPTRRSSSSTSFVPVPPGTRTISGSGSSSKAACASMPSIRMSLRTIPGSRASQVTLAPGSRESTSYGPTASSAVKRS